MGYCGVRIQSDFLLIKKPTLPPGNATSIKVRNISYRHSIFSFEFDITKVKFNFESGDPLYVETENDCRLMKSSSYSRNQSFRIKSEC